MDATIAVLIGVLSAIVTTFLGIAGQKWLYNHNARREADSVRMRTLYGPLEQLLTSGYVTFADDDLEGLRDHLAGAVALIEANNTLADKYLQDNAWRWRAEIAPYASRDEMEEELRALATHVERRFLELQSSLNLRD